ncbi:MAG: ATP-binding protein [Agathobacter sp.]|nr:ATP-binding protein [Agathobacter sp.]
MACAIAMMVFGVFYMFLMHVALTDLLYFAGVEIFLCAVVFVSGYLHYARRVRRLEECGKCLKNEEVVLPEGKDAYEELYQEMIEDLDLQRREETDSLQVQAELEKELFDIEQYVNMALQYQRVNTPGNDYVLEKLRLDDIVREVIHKYAGLMVRAHIPLQYEGTDVMVTTDAKWVAFALEQILSNAIKYSRVGQQIVIETVPEENVDYLKIADHGIGIRAEDLSRVFEKGYTGYNGHADKKSTGIGLYLCRLVLTKLGHTIRMESVQGEGTTVWIGFQK